MKHPAKFSSTILGVIIEILDEEVMLQRHWLNVLDPFAGTGRVHSLLCGETWGVELEPEWATLHPRTLVGDALELPFREESFDAIVTSPTYGNRMADHHDAKDGSERNTYKHKLGRDLHPHNSGQFQWGQKYRGFHQAAWEEVWRTLKPGGLFVLNVSDHIRKGVVQPVAKWHRDTILESFDCKLENEFTVNTPRNGFGQNGSVRVEHEFVYTIRKLLDA